MTEGLSLLSSFLLLRFFYLLPFCCEAIHLNAGMTLSKKKKKNIFLSLAVAH